MRVISIHAAREGGDLVNGGGNVTDQISIHAAREGGDNDLSGYTDDAVISIHAAREGGDHIAASAPVCVNNFNPRRP